LVKPIVEYAAVVWAPYTKKDIDLIERTQHQAARFITRNYSHYTNVNCPTLARCRNEQKAIMMFKIINYLVDILANTFLIPIPNGHSTRGHNMRFRQPLTQTDSYMNSFFPSAIKIWYNLPQNVIDSDNLKQFKQKLSALVII